MRRFMVSPYGFDAHLVEAQNAAKAKYIDFKAAREAGYFQGRDGFWRYLVNGVTVWERVNG